MNSYVLSVLPRTLLRTNNKAPGRVMNIVFVGLILVLCQEKPATAKGAGAGGHKGKGGGKGKGKASAKTKAKKN